jgi:hypothetical protein
MEIAGWGVAAIAETLTAYEKWITKRYGTFLLNDKTDPAAIAPGFNVSNLTLFAYNLDPATNSSSTALSSEVIKGQPAYSTIFVDHGKSFQFARRKSASHPGLSCTMEQSNNLRDWFPVDPSRLTVTSLDDTWEEIRLTESNSNSYFRAKIERTDDTQGTFLPWQQSIAVAGGSPNDRNANLVDDLIEYAFEPLASGGPLRNYDPERDQNKQGLPTIRAGSRPLGRIVYARMKQSSSPGVTYSIQQSLDRITWDPVPLSNLTERILRSDATWEEVECLITQSSPTLIYYRTNIELTQPLLQ